MRPEITTIAHAILVIALGIVACLRNQGVPWIGARSGLAMLWFVLPSLAFQVLAGRLVEVFYRE